MQRWWLIVAGIVGIGLAVLLVPRPDTGAEVPKVNLDNVEVPPLPPIRQNKALPLQDPSEGDQQASADATSSPGEPTATIPRGLIGPGHIRSGPLLNPKAQRLAAMRDTPEARFAARTMGPWTQVRRLLAIKQADQSEVQQVQDLVDGLRQMFRDPTSSDAGSLEQKQTALIDQIRKTDGGDPEIEKMLGLIEQRTSEYHMDQRKNAH